MVEAIDMSRKRDESGKFAPDEQSLSAGLYIKLHPSLKKRFVETAKAKGLHHTVLMRELIEEWLKENEANDS